MEKEIKINGKVFYVWVSSRFWSGYKKYISGLDEEYKFDVDEDYEEFTQIVGSSNKRKTLYLKRLA